MSLMKILEMLLIGPLKLVFEIIYNLAYRMVGHPGLAIIFLSLVMNVLVLPLYKQADMVQEKAKNTFGLILLLAGGGMADAMSKIFEETAPQSLSNHFLFYIFYSY